MTLGASRPRVSLYVPAYNAAATLGACLRAVQRQSLRPDEVIVVDDGSTDGSWRIAHRMGARVIRQSRNRGLAAARNTAVRAAGGDLIASLDADLVAGRHWIRRLTADFGGRRRIVGCCGRVEERYTQSRADRWRSVHMRLDFGRRRSYAPRWLLCGASVIQRQAILDAGLFDERCRTAYDDVDLSARLRAAGHTLLYDPEAVATHLKRSTPADVVRGFWSYWAAKNEMEGAYETLASARRLMVRRQMGIAAHRTTLDVQHRRYGLLPFDLLIPLTFCLRDLETMVRLETLRPDGARTLSCRLVAACREQWARRFSSPLAEGWLRLAFPPEKRPMRGQGSIGSRHERGDRLQSDADGDTESYVRSFSRHFGKLLDGLGDRMRRQVVKALPTILEPIPVGVVARASSP